MSAQILAKLPTVYFNKDQIFWISDDLDLISWISEDLVLICWISSDLDLIFWISDDFDKPKKMRNVRAIIFHQFSRRDLCHVSENKGFRFVKKMLFQLKT